MTPRHRRPTRTDRLLLWAKDRLPLRHDVHRLLRLAADARVDAAYYADVDLGPYAENECHCPPCPGRGNDGHGLSHCAECCFGTGVEVDLDCPVHGLPPEHDERMQNFARILREDGWAETLADIDELPEVNA